MPSSTMIFVYCLILAFFTASLALMHSYGSTDSNMARAARGEKTEPGWKVDVSLIAFCACGICIYVAAKDGWPYRPSQISKNVLAVLKILVFSIVAWAGLFFIFCMG